jgi:SAM-dependent methyltransferase
VTAEDWAPGVDVTVPSAGRMYDYYLNGTHNFAADREAAQRAIAASPGIIRAARANRAFLARAVRYLVAEGIDQFLDIGSGIPTVGNVHEIAQRAHPEARVVYADIDPIAVSHSRLLLADNPYADAIQADLRESVAILEHPTVRSVLDLRRPVGLLLVSMLQFVPDGEAYGAVAGLRDALAPGSHLALSHVAAEAVEGNQARAVSDIYRTTTTPNTTVRGRAGIARFFGGLTLVDPGLVWLPQWRPEPAGEVDEDPQATMMLGGMAAH